GLALPHFLFRRRQHPLGPLTVEVRRGTETGAAAGGVEVSLVSQSTGSAKQKTDNAGRVQFKEIPRGTYQITLDDPDSGMSTSLQHSLFAGLGNSLTVIAPDYAMSPMQCVFDPPLPFPNDRVLWKADLVVRDTINGLHWQLSRALFVGNRSCYAITSREGEMALGEPLPAVLLPPRPIWLEQNTFYYAFFRKDDGAMLPIMPHGALRNEPPELTGDTLVFHLTDDQIAGAAAYVKDYTFASRWLGVDTKRIAPPGQSEHDKYLVAAIPITEALTASVVEAGGGKVTLTVQPNQTANPNSEPGPYELVGSSTNAAVFRLPSLDSVGENAASYDYVFSFCCSSADVSVWTGEQWNKEPGAVFDIRVGETVPSMKDGRWYDATEFVRQYLSRPPAERLNAGLFAQNISKEWLEGIVLSSGAQDKSELPYVLVESDAPPADL
ncbi:MAG: carboxypeptidase-like regulatory domain-containing protein, partial [Candidatus Hydrogenedentes bacterium]|nr:carboxypeptidase-like regulatory domain-containing protein [Candidatus Hydrogenedentota bacterium]